MNILLVSGPGISLKEPYNSGIESFIVSLANQLVDEGHDVDVVAQEAEAHAKFRLINPFRAFTSKRRNFFKRFNEKRQFKKLALNGYDIVHYQMFYPHLLRAGLHFNKTPILTLHSPADKKRVSAYQRLSRQSDVAFVAISERIKHEWDRALNLNIPLINNGINMNLWPVNSSGDRDYLLWSARINKQKNVAAAIYLAKHMQLPLKIAGRITDQHYFEEKVKPHLSSDIEYVGHITQRELSSLAKKATAYLATATWQEPFGLAALEMLASGVPVVGFHTAVPPDWKHESVLTAASLQWQDLVELVKKSNAVSSGVCKEFASNMNIQSMTLNYIKLYEERLLQDGIVEEAVFGYDHILDIAGQQSQTLK
ncbi:glycosyltransferase [Mucilaginibacter sp. CSA2-8R]|uniref:glycosyltransferase n=1 Tax=Mucilaginibacter sp. CSA2-8R TaxID=3141542 RepID=UPI00315D7B6C